MRFQTLVILIACLTAAPARAGSTDRDLRIVDVRMPRHAALVLAESEHIDSIKLLRHGLYHRVRDETKPEVHTREGFSVTVKQLQYISGAAQVPACLGTTFGHEFQVIGAPQGAPVQLQTSVIPPRPMVDPAVDRPIEKTLNTFEIPIGALRAHTYTFDYDWEVIKGTWTFQVWQGDRLMLEDKFDVTGDCAGVSSLTPPNLPRDLNEAPVQG